MRRRDDVEHEEERERGRAAEQGPGEDVAVTAGEAPRRTTEPAVSGKTIRFGSRNVRRSITESATSAAASTRNAGSSQSAPIRAAVAPNRAAVPSATHQPVGVRADRAGSGNGPASTFTFSGTRSVATGSRRPTARPSREQPMTSATSMSQTSAHARRRSMTAISADSPVHRSNARAAWCTSIPRPLAHGPLRARAMASSGVSAGWYTVSRTNWPGCRPGSNGGASRSSRAEWH